MPMHLPRQKEGGTIDATLKKSDSIFHSKTTKKQPLHERFKPQDSNKNEFSVDNRCARYSNDIERNLIIYPMLLDQGGAHEVRH